MNPKNDWFKLFAEKPFAKCRLFCFHYAGGGASMFHSWVKHLPETCEVLAVQLPGRENRLNEEPFRNLENLIAVIVSEIEPFLEKPFVFFGHSMGALVSFEVASRLATKCNKNPEHLFVSGRPSPHLPRKFPPIHHLPEARFIHEIKKYDGMPEEILMDAELRELFFPTLRADLEICEKYVYEKSVKLDVPIGVYGGKSDEGATFDELQEWQKLTRRFAGTKLFDGGHFYFRNSRDAFLTQFSADLSEVINKIRIRESSSIFFSKPNL